MQNKNNIALKNQHQLKQKMCLLNVFISSPLASQAQKIFGQSLKNHNGDSLFINNVLLHSVLQNVIKLDIRLLKIFTETNHSFDCNSKINKSSYVINL